MRLRETILKEHSKSNCTKIVNWVGSNQQRFDELVHLFLTGEYRVVQQAAWPLSYAAQSHPGLVQPHIGKLIKNLHRPGIHDAVKRNTVRILQDISIPKKYHGQLMDTCFGYIVSPVEKPAIKVFSLTILENLSAVYPEIKHELKTIIEDRWDYEKGAFRSRAKYILKRLSSDKL